MNINFKLFIMIIYIVLLSSCAEKISYSGKIFKIDKDFNSFNIVTEKKVNESQKRAMKIGWKIVKYVKSNAIVIANNNQILGIGAGQMSRIDSVKIAVRKIKDAGLSMDMYTGNFTYDEFLQVAQDNNALVDLADTKWNYRDPEDNLVVGFDIGTIMDKRRLDFTFTWNMSFFNRYIWE